ncbi:asparagine synthase-related protein [Sphingomonas qomolangmaensis]|uniref:asparagine synthase (glutamine-hydrolyzing) n=1 Tax=Sphingomonas qomolangmaensis TaxID=2918765 RepID=A0ABY5L9D1_9SPHN|nr:asparagine synthase-related protein [Sphingomonas qomolangmaensis]UUL82380.1 asparagine synthase-related protein [Sphingomonas qomolangmaensis]
MIHLMPDKSGVRVTWHDLGTEPNGLGPSLVFISPGTAIDFSAQMSAELGLSVASGTEAILLAAWAKWDVAMVDRLRGDFAFGIYDPAQGVVFLGRDIFGRAPLYYHLDGDGLVVAGTSRLVRAILGRSLARNEAFYADFVQGQFVEQSATFFEGLERLAPAHWMKIDRGGRELYRYWSPQSVRQHTTMPDAAERFQALFDHSVARAMGGGDALVLLSGGLDSSAILGSVMAANDGGLAPDCLTKTYRRTKDWVDEPYLRSLGAQYGVCPREIACDEHDPLADLDRWLDVLDGPYFSYGHSVTAHLLDIARGMGRLTLLSGHGGDEVVGYGIGRLNELAQQRQWLRLWREAPGLTALSGSSRLRVMRKYLTHYPRYRPFERLLQKQFPDTPSDEEASLSANLLAAMGENRYASQPAVNRGDHDEPTVHAEALNDVVQPLALETIGQCSRAAGVNTEMPFYDRDLVELTLSLPSEWKLRDGFTRYVMRRAMEGRLPRDVLLRQDKFDFTDAFVAGLIAHRHRALALTDNVDGSLDSYVNLPRLAAARAQLSRSERAITKADARFIWRCAVLAMWLKRYETSPPPPMMVPLTQGLIS